MGTDNIHHRRKAREIKDLARRTAKIEPYARILIVCEGSKTEPMYLEGLRRVLRLSTVNIQIIPSKGSSPRTVVETAVKRINMRPTKKSIEEYDHVFCVFDRDDHGESYNEAKCRCDDLSRRGFEAIPSIPSFEYWLLLHFRYTRNQFLTPTNRTPAENLVVELRKCIPQYQKALSNIFDLLYPSLNDAIRHAEAAEKDSLASGQECPSTRMHRLVKLLLQLKRPN